MEKQDLAGYIWLKFFNLATFLIYPKLLKSFYSIICLKTSLTLIFSRIFSRGLADI
jgi:hypothetical protein